VCTTLQETLPAATRGRLIAAGCPPIQGLEDALSAFAKAARQARRVREIRSGNATAALSPNPVPSGEARLLTEWDAKQQLKAHGLTIPAGRLVVAAEGALAASEIGFPVVAKIAQPVLAHKTEAGAVALNLATRKAVDSAVARMSAALAECKPGLQAEKFLIEQQITNAL